MQCVPDTQPGQAALIPQCPFHCPEWQQSSTDSRAECALRTSLLPSEAETSPLHTGASIDFEHTSPTYNHDKARSYWNWIRLWNYAQPPDVILEAGAGQGTVGDGQERAGNRSWQQRWGRVNDSSKRDGPRWRAVDKLKAGKVDKNGEQEP